MRRMTHNEERGDICNYEGRRQARDDIIVDLRQSQQTYSHIEWLVTMLISIVPNPCYWILPTYEKLPPYRNCGGLTRIRCDHNSTCLGSSQFWLSSHHQMLLGSLNDNHIFVLRTLDELNLFALDILIFLDHSFVRSFVRSSFRSLVRSLARPLARSLARLLIRSFARFPRRIYRFIRTTY